MTRGFTSKSQICVSQFWTDENKPTRGFWNVRLVRYDERVATTSFKIRMSPQFWTSDEHEVTRGWSPDQTHPAQKKKEFFFEEVLTYNHSFLVYEHRVDSTSAICKTPPSRGMVGRALGTSNCHVLTHS